jgi:hypothetical protein
VFVGLMIWPIGLLSSFAGSVAMAWSNRRRELRADRLAAKVLGSWEPIGEALKRIMGHPRSGRISGAECRKLGHLMFAQANGSSGGIFGTHPKMTQRIRRADRTWDGVPIYENTDSKFADPSQMVDMERVEQTLCDLAASKVDVFRAADAVVVTVPALLLFDPRHRSIAPAVLDAPILETVEILWDCIEAVDPKERFALTELAFATARQFGTPTLGGILKSISDQLPSDSWPAWFWTQVFLDAIVHEQVPTRVTMKDCRGCTKELAQVFSLGASLDSGTVSVRNMRELRFQRLWMAAGLESMDYVPVDDITPKTLSRAVKTLSHLPKKHLSILLKRLVDLFETQDRVSADQAAYLRYLTASWNMVTEEPPFTMISKSPSEPQLTYR